MLTVTGGHLGFKCTVRVGVEVYSGREKERPNDTLFVFLCTEGQASRFLAVGADTLPKVLLSTFEKTFWPVLNVVLLPC